MTEKNEDNLIKQICKNLNLTYKQLAEKIGVSEDTIKSSASRNKISLQMQKSIELLIENEKLKNENEEINELRKLLYKFIQLKKEQ